ncbi:hypothetical protein HK098_000303 [Nowakowskiella sp. JEL0407]|nr:hypothetical protein HK098_000303 [Nowakowskiella sp. JEL0407]
MEKIEKSHLSLLVAYQLSNKHVLVIGGGKESYGRVSQAYDAGANVTLLAPKESLTPDVASYVAENNIKLISRDYVDGDIIAVERSHIDGSVLPPPENLPTDHPGPVDLVLAALDTDNPELLKISRKIGITCNAQRIPVNCADVPDACNFFFMAQHRVGLTDSSGDGRDSSKLQIGISSNGCGPRLAVRVREDIKKAIHPLAGVALEKVYRVRMLVRSKDPSPESAGRRMTWLSRLCDEWTWEEMAAIDEDAVADLLDKYEKGEKVPPARKKRAGSDKPMEKSKGINMTKTVGLRAANVFGSVRDGIISTLKSILKLFYSFFNVFNRRSILPATTKPKLYLVGGGPGNPEYLTRRAYEILTNEADLIITDRLIAPEIIQLIPTTSQSSHINRKLQSIGMERLSYVPEKNKGRSDIAQDTANTMVYKALGAGLRVARLKSGDPFVFGRGAEEILNVWNEKFVFGDETVTGKSVDVEVVPGISTCIAGPESGMIPVTHRGAADQLLVLTGRGEAGALPDFPNYHEKRTIVVLMGVLRLAQLLEMLKNMGYPIELPVAVVEKATWRNQKVIRGTVGDILQKVQDAEASGKKVESPSLLVFGNVVNVLA